MRRPNGSGSITKLSGNRRRPYMVRVFKHFKLNGSPVHEVIGYFKTRKEADAALVEYNKDPKAYSISTLTFKDVWEMFIKQRYVDNGMKVPNAYHAAYNWLKDVQKMPFGEIKLFHLQKAVNDCTLNVSTKKNIKIVANLVFKYAIGNDIATRNYAELVKLPEGEKSNLHKEITLEELKLLWNNTKIPAVKTVLILAYTGMRPSSFINMLTEDVHLEEQYMVGGVKNASSRRRDIPIADCILPFVKELYNPESKYLLGSEMSYETFAKNFFNPAMEALQLSHLPHDGRVTCETQLDRLKVQSSVIDAILGHAQKSVGEKYYRKVTVADRLAAVNQIPCWPNMDANA